MNFSVVMVTHNSGDVVESALESVRGLWDELLVEDAESTDGTVDIINRYRGKILQSDETALGKRKQWLIDKARGDWILILDSDERVSPQLYREIKRVTRVQSEIVGYRIPYQNYGFGRPIFYGGERYSKVRLFRRSKGRVAEVPLHEEVIVEGKIQTLNGVINHHSYRTPGQLFSKFTRYAWIAAKEKQEQGEKVSLRKLFLDGPHMFWARFFKDQGYKDGWRGAVLAFAFAYMEMLTYWTLLAQKILKSKK